MSEKCCNNQEAEKLRELLGGYVSVLYNVVVLRDPYTGGHQKRVADLARAIATHMGLKHEIIEKIRVAGTLHDIGKIAIPAEILTTPAKLRPTEYNLIKDHAELGHNVLLEAHQPPVVLRMVLQHHERLDGTGYPKGLKEKEICPEANIIAVADVVEAMSSHRPYRAALGMEAALGEITKHRGIKYDKEVVGACLYVFEQDVFKFKSG